MKVKKGLAMLLSAIMLISMLTVPALAAETGPSYPDVPDDHWAGEVINKWSAGGLVNGYSDGNFGPGDQITRGQMAALLDRLMDYQTKATNNYSDLPNGEWYTDAILGASAARVIQGSDGLVRPEAPITREEAMVMIVRVLGVTETTTSSVSFSDEALISDWARDAVRIMAAKGYVQGYDGAIRPRDTITRAEALTMLDNVFHNLYSAPGTYTDEVTGNVLVNTSNVVLKDMTVTGDLIVAEGVGDGDLTLENVQVAGRLVVRGGGVNSIHIKGGSAVGQVSLLRGDGGVRLAVEDGAKIEVVFVADGSNDVVLEGSFGSVNVDSGVNVALKNGTVSELKVGEGAEGAKVDIGADVKVESAIVAAPQAALSVSGTVGKVEIAESAANTAVSTEKGAKIDQISSAANNVAVTGEGQVTKVTVSKGEGVKVETPNTNVTVDKGAGEVTTGAGGTVKPGDNSSTGGGSTGGGGGGGGGGGATNYTVTFDSQGGSAVSSMSVPAGNGISKPEPNPTKEGFTFGGWYTDQQCTVAFRFTGSAGLGDVINGNITLYAKWIMDEPVEPGTYAVKLNLNGGTYNGQTGIATLTAPEGETITLPGANQVTRDGYTFGGWYDNENLTGTAVTSVSATATLYAKWIPNDDPDATYTVTFDSQGGSTVSSMSVTAGNGISKPDPDPTKEGYIFGGWYTDEACTTAFRFTGSAGLGDIINGNITLYAKWIMDEPVEPGTYAVKLNLNGGTYNGQTGIVTLTAPEGETITLPGANQVTLENNTFGGWYDNANLTGAAVTSVDAAAELYAKWTPNNPDATYTVTFNSQGGSTVESISDVPSGDDISKPDPDPTKKGFTFGGWYTDEACTTAFRFTGSAGMGDAITANITLYAKWTANTYTVKFDLNDGTYTGSIDLNTYSLSGTYGEKLSADADNVFLDESLLARDAGQTFAGWAVGSVDSTTIIATGGLGDAMNLEAVDGETVTLYAKWSNTYTIKFDLGDSTYDGASTIRTIDATYDKADGLTTISFPDFSKMEREGYDFSGWSLEPNGEPVVKADNLATVKNLAPVGETVTLYAVWKPKTSTP